MSQTIKETRLLELKTRANYYKTVLAFKKATLKNIHNFIQYVIAYYPTLAEPETHKPLVERAKAGDRSAMATILYYIDCYKTPLETSWTITMNMLALSKLLDTGDYDWLINIRITQLTERDIHQFLDEGRIYAWRLGIRELYYKNLEMESEMKVPVDWERRQPDLYLEDLLQNLEEEIAQLQHELGQT